MSTTPTSSNRGALLDAALRTAIALRHHRKYAPEAKALESLRRRCRGFSWVRYRNALAKGVALLGGVEEVIAPIDPHYHASTGFERGWPSATEAARGAPES